jgi:hypothetical protein
LYKGLQPKGAGETMKVNQTYTAKFRAEAVKLVLDQALIWPEAAE